jgi:deoxycytidylate deaminase
MLMRRLDGHDFKRARQYMMRATEIGSKNSLCLRWHCGAVVVASDGVIIGEGANVPADGKPVTKCIKYLVAPDFKSDKHCCVHAEQVAIDDAIRKHADQVPGSTIYFSRVKPRGPRVPSGKPWCTTCSKAALFAGLAEFVLWHENGIYAYTTLEYNELSFKYTALKPKPECPERCINLRQLLLFDA